MDSGLKISATSSEPPKGRRDQKKQETRTLLYETAIQLFAEKGFEHVSADEIADRAGVSRATVFNYFPSKFDFISAYGDDYRDTLLNYWETLSHLPPLARLDTMCRFSAKEAERRRNLMDLLTVNTYMNGPDRSRAERLRWMRLYELLFQVIDDAKRAGEVRTDIDTMDIAAMFDSVFSSVFAERVIAGADIPVAEKIAARYDIIRAGIVAAAQTRKP